jgi:hypothetical protein
MRLIGAVAIAILMLAACDAGAAPPPAATPAPSMTPTPDETAPLVALARADAAQRSGLPVENLRLVSVTATTWASSAFGCNTGVDAGVGPITGYVIILQAGKHPYEYHAANGQVVYCDPTPRP